MDGDIVLPELIRLSSAFVVGGLGPGNLQCSIDSAFFRLPLEIHVGLCHLWEATW